MIPSSRATSPNHQTSDAAPVRVRIFFEVLRILGWLLLFFGFSLILNLVTLGSQLAGASDVLTRRELGLATLGLGATAFLVRTRPTQRSLAILEAGNKQEPLSENQPSLPRNLTGAGFARQILKGAVLSGRKLDGADLKETDLSNAELVSASLRYTNLSSASLQKANLEGASLTGSNLARATLSGANLRSVVLDFTNLTEVDLSYTNLSHASLRDAEISGADFSGAHLYKADIARAWWNPAHPPRWPDDHSSLNETLNRPLERMSTVVRLRRNLGPDTEIADILQILSDIEKVTAFAHRIDISVEEAEAKAHNQTNFETVSPTVIRELSYNNPIEIEITKEVGMAIATAIGASGGFTGLALIVRTIFGSGPEERANAKLIQALAKSVDENPPSEAMERLRSSGFEFDIRSFKKHSPDS